MANGEVDAASLALFKALNGTPGWNAARDAAKRRSRRYIIIDDVEDAGEPISRERMAEILEAIRRVVPLGATVRVSTPWKPEHPYTTAHSPMDDVRRLRQEMESDVVP